MKILLTGKPGIGKTTIIEKFRKNYHGKICGIIAKEIRDVNNKRVGFEAVKLNGERKVFAHHYLIQSPIKHGRSNFHIDINAIDNFIVPELQKGLQDTNSLLLLDEIGPM